MLIETLLATLKCRRFYILAVLVLVAGVGVRMLPTDSKHLVCDTWKRLAQIVVSNATASERPPVAGRSDTAIIEEAGRLFCPAKGTTSQSTDVTVVGVVRSSLEVLPAAVAIALLVTLLLPASTTRAEVRADSTSEREEIQNVVSARDVPGMERHLRQLSQDAVALAIRARQLRVAIVYAVGSCLATLLFPPDFESGGSLQSIENVLHVSALLVVAAAAGGFGLHIFVSSTREVCRLAAQVAFAGVFFAGLIALAIAIPYRMMTTIEGAALGVEQVRFFAGMRLIVIPLAAALGGGAWLAGLRAYRRIPVKLLLRRDPQQLDVTGVKG